MITNSHGESDRLTTDLNVRQGSVLGPQFFRIYINDIHKILTRDVSHLLYADDLQTYTQVTRADIKVGIERLSAVAQAVSDWATKNGLSLNFRKTKAIIFGSTYNIGKVHNMNLLGITVQVGVTVPFTDSVTNLGVEIDSELSWKPQVDAASRKVN